MGMLDGIFSFLESPDCPNDGFVRLDSVRFEAHDAILDLSVMDYDEAGQWARWQIRACQMRQCTIGKAGGDLVLHQGDHVVVRQHTDFRQELYFRGTPDSADGTIGRLWIAHREAVSDWIPFDDFLNSCMSLQALLKVGFGLLADGPVFLIEAYSRVLSADGLSPRVLAPRPAKWWNGHVWSGNPSELVALSLGDSLVVAQSFEETRLDGSAG